MDIEEMSTAQIYDALTGRLEYECERVGRNTGHSAWTEAEKERLDKVISLLGQSAALYKKRAEVSVKYR